jgi:branched-chain amino acid transport system substrate-binding protein
VGAAAFISAGASSCGATGGSSVTASGSTLTVYVSAPRTQSAAVKDTIDAEQLAFQQLGSAPIGKFKLRLASVDGAELSDNARTAIQDTGAVAYLGEITPGSSAATLGITNAQDLLQVSPTDNALELTQTTPAISNTPNRYYESLSTYGRTFARMVPSSGVEAKAQVQEMKALGISKLYVANDGTPYGIALAAAVRTAAAPDITIVAAPAGADGMFYGAANEAPAAQAFMKAAQATPAIKLFGPSALDDPAFVTLLGAGARNVYISSPGFLSKELTPEGRTFVSDFTKAYGHAPASEAIFGYAAMQAVLNAIKQAGASANARATVVKDFFPATNRPSVLGTYSIDGNGDISLPAFVFSRLEHGALVPFKSVQVQG